MRRIVWIAFIILPVAMFVTQAFGGIEISIKSATVNSSTLTLKGSNFDANGGVLTVIINGTILNGCVLTSDEVTCDLAGLTTLEPGTTYTISVSGGNAPSLNTKIDVYMLDGLLGTCPSGASTSCYNGPSGTIGIGECQSGTITCVAGIWGNCTGEVLPATEICNDNKDNDCDGLTDCDDTVDCPDTNDPCIPVCTDNDEDGVCADEDCDDNNPLIWENCPVSCSSGWADCDGDPNNGCETDILTNINNCGACGNSCEVSGPGYFQCSNGVCYYTP